MNISHVQRILQESCNALQSIENEEELVDHLNKISDIVSTHQIDHPAVPTTIAHDLNLVIDKIKIKETKKNIDSDATDVLQSVIDAQVEILNKMADCQSQDSSEFHTLSPEEYNELKQGMKETSEILEEFKTQNEKIALAHLEILERLEKTKKLLKDMSQTDISPIEVSEKSQSIVDNILDQEKQEEFYDALDKL